MCNTVIYMRVNNNISFEYILSRVIYYFLLLSKNKLKVLEGTDFEKNVSIAYCSINHIFEKVDAFLISGTCSAPNFLFQILNSNLLLLFVTTILGVNSIFKQCIRMSYDELVG